MMKDAPAARIASALDRARRACDRIDTLAIRHRALCDAVEQVIIDLDRIGIEQTPSHG